MWEQHGIATQDAQATVDPLCGTKGKTKTEKKAMGYIFYFSGAIGLRWTNALFFTKGI